MIGSTLLYKRGRLALEAAKLDTAVRDGALALLEAYCTKKAGDEAVILFCALIEGVFGSTTTDDPEWEDVSDLVGYPTWQSRRDHRLFSNDAGKTSHTAGTAA